MQLSGSRHQASRPRSGKRYQCNSEAGVDVGVTLPAGHSLLGVEGAGDVLVVASKDVKPSNSKSLLRRRIWRTWQRSRCRGPNRRVCW
ncbi:hypothetical protein PC129_g18727 [Phytophthora cactorum]|uniref:Uncharacterized protein n=1 Tax=Phytophthora cactorum TaxID=29920 RepID=A0A8T1HDP7_9STRA|nr:hypothetical protein PC129_g18727 [Phytophthora cactorum]